MSQALKMNARIFSQKGSGVQSVTERGLGETTSWLMEITRPAATGSATGHSIAFAVLTPNDGQHGCIEDEDVICLSGILEAMRLDPKQIIVQNDTVDFNIHHIDYSLDKTTDDQSLPVYSIADNLFGICWTWDPLSYSTRGLIWHCNDEGERQAHFILDGLSRLALTHSHGLLPALLALQVETTEMRVWIDRPAEEIMEVQVRTGHHAYADAPFSSEETGSTRSDSRIEDLAMISRRICGMAVNITTCALCLQRIVQLADFILEEATECMRTLQTTNAGSARAQQYLDSTCFIIQRTRSAKRQAEGLLAEAEAWKHKATIVVQTLLSLITQRDQNVGIGIAEDPRTLARKVTRDSKSMKAIAAVTMCFLPGTFVSSLFAMPMFNWDASGSARSIDRHFWIYWAVTLPLTVVVIVVWLAWTNANVLRSVVKVNGTRQKTEKEV